MAGTTMLVTDKINSKHVSLKIKIYHDDKNHF